MSDKNQISKKSKADIAHLVTKILVSAIPVLGGPAAEIFTFLVQSPLETRRDTWIKSLGGGLMALEKNSIRIEDLQKNDNFISSLLQATQIALRNHEKEKLEALRNAIINIAKGETPEESLQMIFFNFIDTFNVWHLKILKEFQSPKPPVDLMMGGLSNVLEYTFPEFKDKRYIYEQFWKDLYTRGLVNTQSLNITILADSLRLKRTSEIGDIFLKFIESN